MSTKHLQKHNEARKINLPPNKIEEMYMSGMTIAEIARHYGVSVQPIKRIMVEHGIKARPPAPRRGIMGGEDNPSWNGGRRIRPDGYVLVWTPAGERLEHRVVMEKKLGRKLLGTEVVHHLDGNQTNNSPDNLRLFSSQSEHATMHATENRRILIASGLKGCTRCNRIKPLSEFYKTKHNKMGYQSWCKKCKNLVDGNRKKQKRGPS